jgi:hypothetical protein
MRDEFCFKEDGVYEAMASIVWSQMKIIERFLVKRIASGSS